MKTIFVPASRPRREQWGLADSFMRLTDCIVFDHLKYRYSGYTVEEIRKRFLRDVTTLHPDLLFLHVGFTNMFPNQFVEAARSICPDMVVVNFFRDWRDHVSSQVRARARVCDALLISNDAESQHAMYKEAGYRHVIYFPTAVPARWHQFDSKPACDVMFMNNYRKEFQRSSARNELFIRLHETYGERAWLVGHSWDRLSRETRFHDQLDLMSRAKVNVSFSNQTAHRYFSIRLLYCLASGRPTVADRFPGWEGMFLPGTDLLFFNPDNIDDCIQKINQLLEDPKMADAMGHRGRSIVRSFHTWDRRVERLESEIVPKLRGAQ